MSLAIAKKMSTDTQHPTPAAPPPDVEQTLVPPAQQNTNEQVPSSRKGRKASWHDFWDGRRQTWYRRTNTNALFWARLNLIIWTASLLINVGITIYLLVLCIREKDPYARRLRFLWLGSQLMIIWLLTWHAFISSEREKRKMRLANLLERTIRVTAMTKAKRSAPAPDVGVR